MQAQKATRETEDLALARRKENEATKEGADALNEYIATIKGLEINEIRKKLADLLAPMDAGGFIIKGIGDSFDKIQAGLNELIERKDKFISELYKEPEADKLKRLEYVMQVAKQLSLTVEIDISPDEKAKLDAIVKYSQEEINKLKAETVGWQKTLKSALNFSSEDVVAGLLSTGAGAINEYAKRLQAAEERALSFDGILGDQVSVLQNTAGQWEKLLSAMVESGHWEKSEESIQKVIDELNKARDAAGQAGAAKAIVELQKKVDDLGKSESRLAYEAALANKALPEQAEEIRRLMGEYSRKEIVADYQRKIDELTKSQKELALASFLATGAQEDEIAAFEQLLDRLEKLKGEAGVIVKNWQEELSDNLLIITMNLKIFSDEASVIISDLSAQLIELSSSAALSGFEEFGYALGEGKDAAESLRQAVADMAHQILKQLPMMFLQAGLQLIANGQWAIGLGFVAAAGSSAIISGYVDGASKHAYGGVFDEYGQAARTFAAGGAFTNQIVSSPAYFAHGGGLGLMGEAGPEAILPLSRMPNGDLGVQTAGGGANVVVNIINNSNAEVRQEESTDAEGNKQIDVMIGQFVNNHITSGKADRAMSRFGVRPVGV